MVATKIRALIFATLATLVFFVFSPTVRAGQSGPERASVFQSIESARKVIEGKIDWKSQALGNLSATYIKGDTLRIVDGGPKIRRDGYYWMVSVDVLSKDAMQLLYVVIIIVDASSGEALT